MDGDARHDRFLRVLSQHSRRIFAFIATLVFCNSDAEDIFQDVCVVLWKKFDEYDESGSFYAWACKIAYLEILHLRRRNRQLQIFSEEVMTLLADNLLARQPKQETRDSALEECLGKLPDRDQQLIRQRYYLLRRPGEIATERGVSMHAIYRSLVRIHNSLRNCIEIAIAKEERQ